MATIVQSIPHVRPSARKLARKLMHRAVLRMAGVAVALMVFAVFDYAPSWHTTPQAASPTVAASPRV